MQDGRGPPPFPPREIDRASPAKTGYFSTFSQFFRHLHLTSPVLAHRTAPLHLCQAHTKHAHLTSRTRPHTSHKRVAPTLATRRLASSRRPHAHLSSHRTLRPIPTRANSHVRPVVCATHGAICPGTNALRTRSGQSGGPPPRRNHAAVGRAPCAREHRCSHAHPIQLPRAARRARLGPLCGRLPPHCPSRRRRRGHCPGRSP